jgi:trimeric autotransporter adhesin
VEIEHGLQLFRGPGCREAFRQTIEPGTVFVLQRHFTATTGRPASRSGRARGTGVRARVLPRWRHLAQRRAKWRSATVMGRAPRRGRLGIVWFLLAIAAVTSAHRASPLPPASTPTPPLASTATMRAHDFYSKFGANTDINSGQSISSILTDLQYLGVYNIRDSIYSEGHAKAFAGLAARGVKLHIDFQGWRHPAASMSNWLGWLKTYLVVPHPGSVVGVSGPNEVDNTGAAFVYAGLSGVLAANKAQEDLYNGIKSDSVLKRIPVDMWPLAFPYKSSSTQQVGNMTAYCDRANMHDYYSADDYARSVNGTTGDMQVQMPLYLADYQKVCDRAKWITTESGWYTPWRQGDNHLGTNETVQAHMLLSDLFDHAMLPNNQGVYIFDLQWGSADGSYQGWGVFHDDGTPKVSGTAIHNLSAILNDPGTNAATFTPASLSYSLSGMPAASGNFAIAKSDGSFDIILWNETPIWNISTGTQLTIPTRTVTVFLPPGSSGSVYDPMQGTTPISTFSKVTQFPVYLNASTLIIRIDCQSARKRDPGSASN